jgi:XTP/dITP diphosphohydrolase
MPGPLRLLIATRNAGKLRELRSLLAGYEVEVVGPDDVAGLPEDVPETGDSFRANAEIKARAYAEAAGCWALADDSGLEVDALDGAPGVYSARYAGPEADDAANNAKLLEAMAGVPEPERGARFRCAAVCCDAQGNVLGVGEGATEGRILEAPAGIRGFGYDPLFLSDDLGKPFGEAEPAEKNRVSHRARALVALRTVLLMYLPHK